MLEEKEIDTDTFFVSTNNIEIVNKSDSAVPPVSRTAWYTLSSRAEDAKKKQSICNDIYAEQLMSSEANDVFDNFKKLGDHNAINVVRHRIIDDQLKEIIMNTNKNVRIFLLGAGFDTRSFRIMGGRWVEFDDPAVINHKNNRMPVSHCLNNLVRIPIVWGVEELTDKMNKFLEMSPANKDEKVVIIYEGVFMYLQENQIVSILYELQTIFSEHVLICDLLSKYVFDWYSQKVHTVINNSCNATFHCFDDPWITIQSTGYELVKNISCVEVASELGAVWQPRFLFRGFLFTWLRKGYGVWIWNYKKT
jgi:O-methyltransferase involved in polyketide biosynthesis